MPVVMALLLTLQVPNASAEGAVPGWVRAEIDTGAPIIAGLLGLPRVPFIRLSHDEGAAPPGVRVIEAEAGAEEITVRLLGDWQRADDAARRVLVRNLAHELAHVWQYTLGLPTEPRFFHEGFAEALALEALENCGASCSADPEGLRAMHERDCSAAMRQEPLARAESRSALYGCGAVLAGLTAQRAEISVADLYARFAARGRSPEAFFVVAGEAAGQPFELSARAFFTGDYRLASPRDVIARLRAGRL